MTALEVCSKITCSPQYECMHSYPEITCDDHCAEQSSQKTHMFTDRSNTVLFQSLVQEDTLEGEMTAHCRILALRILWRAVVHGSQTVGHDLAIEDRFTQ